MRNLPNCIVDADGSKGEIFVSDNEGGKYMCVFVKTDVTDFTAIYNAYGFMVWTQIATLGAPEFYPIKLREQTKLTDSVMHEMWRQICEQIPVN